MRDDESNGWCTWRLHSIGVKCQVLHEGSGCAGSSEKQSGRTVHFRAQHVAALEFMAMAKPYVRKATAFEGIRFFVSFPLLFSLKIYTMEKI